MPRDRIKYAISHARAEKNYAQKMKLAVVRFYCAGEPRCQCPGCHTTSFCFLSIDHKDGKGHSHKIGNWKISGKALWLWIIRNGFPDGFQVLCWNCNCAKRTAESCPMAGRPH